jgi:hypothetical protein
MYRRRRQFYCIQGDAEFVDIIGNEISKFLSLRLSLSLRLGHGLKSTFFILSHPPKTKYKGSRLKAMTKTKAEA